MSKKNKTTVKPLGEYAPYIDQGAQTYQTTLQQQQPANNAVQGLLGGALDRFGAKVMQPDNFLEGAKLEAARTAGGNWMGSNPGAAQYGQIAGQAMANPAFSALNGYGGTNPAISALGGFAGRTNPGMSALANVGASANPATAGLQRMADGGYTTAGDDYFAKAAGGGYLNGAPTSSFYNDTLSGKYLDNNPYFEQMLDQQLKQIENRVNSTWSQAGRGFGRDSSYTGLMTRELANAAVGARYANYNAERDRQMQASGLYDATYGRERGMQQDAAGQLASGARADRSQQTQAYGLLSDAYGQDQNRQLQAGQSMGSLWGADQGRELQAATAMGGLYGDDQARRLQAATSMGGLYNDASRTALSAAQAGDSMWDAERNRMVSSANAAPAFTDAGYAGINGLLSLSEGYLNAPWTAANQYGEGVGGLLSPYAVTKNKTSGLGNAIGVMNDTANTAANAYFAGTAGGRKR